MAEADRARARDRHALDAGPVLERAVGRPGVFEQPVACVLPEDGVAPRHAGVVDEDVGLRVPADVVTSAGGKRALRVWGANEQHRTSGRLGGLRRHGVTVGPISWAWIPLWAGRLPARLRLGSFMITGTFSQYREKYLHDHEGCHALSTGPRRQRKAGSSDAYRQRRLRRTGSNRILGKPILSAVPI